MILLLFLLLLLRLLLLLLRLRLLRRLPFLDLPWSLVFGRLPHLLDVGRGGGIPSFLFVTRWLGFRVGGLNGLVQFRDEPDMGN